MNAVTQYQWFNRSAIALTSALTAIALLPDTAVAQIIPDRTLGSEQSILNQNVTINNRNSDHIEGGAIRGANLFHSFQDFNVSEGRSVYFANPTGISNIFSRITGSNPSNLLGTLGVLGNANLFFLNPNGIIFGRNARLDVKGSFVASTASAIQFGNQGVFSTSDAGAPSLLTINPSAFWFNQLPRGDIVSNSVSPVAQDNNVPGLAVPDGKSLTLLGGNVSINGSDLNGGLSALGGRIEIGAVAGTGAIAFNENGHLSFPTNLDRADVSFTNQAQVRVVHAGQGDIGITARNIDIRDGSILLAGIGTDEGALDRQAGNIVLDATGVVTLSGGSVINNTALGTGNAGNIEIISRALSVNQSQIFAATFGQGNGGSIILRALDTISLGKNAFVGSSVEKSEAVGNSGSINITADSLRLADNAVVFADTFGQGDAGNITINTRDVVSLDDSAIFSNVARTGRGQGGDIQIVAKSLSLTTGSQLTASTRGQGNAGNVSVIVDDAVLLDGATRDAQSPSAIFSSVNAAEAIGNGGDIEIVADSLIVSNGARLRASTQGRGNAGNILITARNAVYFNGGSSDGRYKSSAITGVGREGVGNAGDIKITTTSIRISNDARLLANTQGQGKAGDIILNARSIVLDQGGLVAEAEQVGGANIRLQDVNLLLMKNGSLISAQAFEDAIGGNVTIDASNGFVVALLNQNSDIIANAVRERGGNIQITAQGIFGIEQQRAIPPNQTNDIDASSEFNQSGTVTINRPDVDPTQGLVELPSEPRPSQPLASCQPGGAKGGRFIVTGSGGLPTQPDEPLSSLGSLDDLPLPDQWRTSFREAPKDRVAISTQTTPSATPTIEEAQGWIINPQGEVKLVADQQSQLPCSAKRD